MSHHIDPINKGSHILAQPLLFGKHWLPNRLFLAPMAGFTNYPTRQISRDFGASLAFTEMVSVEGLSRQNVKSKRIARSGPSEKGLALQIFGHDLKSFAEATRKISHYDYVSLDINMGCPVPKVAERAQAGAALLRDPKKITAIVSTVCKLTTKLVSVKIRSGWDQNSVNYTLVARAAIQGGAKAITLHPRTREQRYSGEAKWEQVGHLKRLYPNVIIVGNGDVKTASDVKKRYAQTGCDAIMIGRSALGNPWFFQNVLEQLGAENFQKISPDIISVLAQHHSYLAQTEVANNFYPAFRKVVLFYLKTIHSSPDLKLLAQKMNNLSDFQNLLQNLEECGFNRNNHYNEVL